MPSRICVACAALLFAAVIACRDATTGIRMEFVGSYAFSATERRTIARIAGLAALEARRSLPALAPQITLQVQSGKDVIPELGATAAVAGSEWVRWTVDPDHPGGVVKIAESHLRGTLFHEFHHLVRSSTVSYHTLMDHVISEGLATAFERDFAGACTRGATTRATYRSGLMNFCCCRRRQIAGNGCSSILTAAAGLDTGLERIWSIRR